ncbi:MAG TPA: DUF2157 domain-containing protein [Methylophilaceae bacterium]|nr:DUF2157 domain-containing protein [Methylophilaceae bacterium]HQR60044.1 DUF2157 domain-containing protein [Methylophilaceae bacterium]
MSTRQDAIIEVVDIIKRHNLSLVEIAEALKGGLEIKAERSSGILSRLFGYIGGIFVFAGLAIYIGMQWSSLSPASRILLTLGTGFSVFVLALVCTTDDRFEKAATPLFLVAALLEPTGILVTLHEFSRGGDPAYGLLFLNLVMAIQQGCAFYARRRSVLAVTAVYFSVGFFVITFDLLHVERHLIGLTIGLSLLSIGWSIDKSRHKPVAALVYFVGAILFLATAYDWLDHRPYQILFLALACGTIFLSTVARSRTLLLIGTLALIGYIGKYMAEHFAHNLAGPVGLMLAGFLLIAVGALAVRINNRYIREKR